MPPLSLSSFFRAPAAAAKVDAPAVSKDTTAAAVKVPAPAPTPPAEPTVKKLSMFELMSAAKPKKAAEAACTAAPAPIDVDMCARPKARPRSHEHSSKQGRRHYTASKRGLWQLVIHQYSSGLPVLP